MSVFIPVSCLQMTFLEKKSIAMEITQAIAFLHSTSPPTVHLDLKPANIFVRMIDYVLQHE